jgi:putative transposase
VLLGKRHVQRVLAEYITLYNTRRPHQGLVQQCPVPLTVVPSHGSVQRRNVLGGIVHNYVRATA